MIHECGSSSSSSSSSSKEDHRLFEPNKTQVHKQQQQIDSKVLANLLHNNTQLPRAPEKNSSDVNNNNNSQLLCQSTRGPPSDRENRCWLWRQKEAKQGECKQQSKQQQQQQIDSKVLANAPASMKNLLNNTQLPRAPEENSSDVNNNNSQQVMEAKQGKCKQQSKQQHQASLGSGSEDQQQLASHRSFECENHNQDDQDVYEHNKSLIDILKNLHKQMVPTQPEELSDESLSSSSSSSSSSNYIVCPTTTALDRRTHAQLLHNDDNQAKASIKKIRTNHSNESHDSTQRHSSTMGPKTEESASARSAIRHHQLQYSGLNDYNPDNNNTPDISAHQREQQQHSKQFTHNTTLTTSQIQHQVASLDIDPSDVIVSGNDDELLTRDSLVETPEQQHLGKSHHHRIETIYFNDINKRPINIDRSPLSNSVQKLRLDYTDKQLKSRLSSAKGSERTVNSGKLDELHQYVKSAAARAHSGRPQQQHWRGLEQVPNKIASAHAKSEYDNESENVQGKPTNPNQIGRGSPTLEDKRQKSISDTCTNNHLHVPAARGCINGSRVVCNSSGNSSNSITIATSTSTNSDSKCSLFAITSQTKSQTKNHGQMGSALGHASHSLCESIQSSQATNPTSKQHTVVNNTHANAKIIVHNLSKNNSNNNNKASNNISALTSKCSIRNKKIQSSVVTTTTKLPEKNTNQSTIIKLKQQTTPQTTTKLTTTNISTSTLRQNSHENQHRSAKLSVISNNNNNLDPINNKDKFVENLLKSDTSTTSLTIPTSNNTNNENVASTGLDAMTSKNHKYLDSIDSELRFKRNSIKNAATGQTTATATNLTGDNLDQVNITIVDKYINHGSATNNNNITTSQRIRGQSSAITTTGENMLIRTTDVNQTITTTAVCSDADGGLYVKRNNNNKLVSSLRRQKLLRLQTNRQHNQSIDSQGDDASNLDEEEEEAGAEEQEEELSSDNLAHNPSVRFAPPDSSCSTVVTEKQLNNKFSSVLEATSPNDINRKSAALVKNKSGNLIKSTSSSLATTDTVVTSSACARNNTNGPYNHVLSSHSFSCGSSNKNAQTFSNKLHFVESLLLNNASSSSTTSTTSNSNCNNFKFPRSRPFKQHHHQQFNNHSSAIGDEIASQNGDDLGQQSSSVSSRVSLSSSSFNDDENMIYYDDDDDDDNDDGEYDDTTTSPRCNLSSSSSNTNPLNQTSPLNDLFKLTRHHFSGEFSGEFPGEFSSKFSSSNDPPLMLRINSSNGSNGIDRLYSGDLDDSTSDIVSLTQSPLPNIQTANLMPNKPNSTTATATSTYAYKISISTAKIDQQSNQLKISQPKIITSSGELLTASATTCDTISISSPVVLATSATALATSTTRTSQTNNFQQTVGTISPIVSASGLCLHLPLTDPLAPSSPFKEAQCKAPLAVVTANRCQSPITSTAITAITIGSPVQTMPDLLPIQPELAATIVGERHNVTSPSTLALVAVSQQQSSTITSSSSTRATTAKFPTSYDKPQSSDLASSLNAQLTCRLDVGDTIKISSAIVEVPTNNPTAPLKISSPCYFKATSNRSQSSCMNDDDDDEDNNKIIIDVRGDDYHIDTMNRGPNNNNNSNNNSGYNGDDNNNYGAYSAVSSISINNGSSSDYSSTSPINKQIILGATTVNGGGSNNSGGTTFMIDDHIYEDIFEYQRISSSSLRSDVFSSCNSPEEEDHEEEEEEENNSKNCSLASATTTSGSKDKLTSATSITVCDFESPKKSIFEGASKDEILEYLEDARERVPEVLMAADDVMMIGNGELIVVNQLDPGSPATPISIVEPSEVGTRNQDSCLSSINQKPNINWQQRLYSHTNNNNQQQQHYHHHRQHRHQHQHQRSISSNSMIVASGDTKPNNETTLNELPNEDQSDNQLEEDHACYDEQLVISKLNRTLPFLPPVPPPRVSSITDRSNSLATTRGDNISGLSGFKPSLIGSTLYHQQHTTQASASSNSSGSSSTSSSLSSGISSSDAAASNNMKSSSIITSSGSSLLDHHQTSSSELNMIIGPLNQPLTTQHAGQPTSMAASIAAPVITSSGDGISNGNVNCRRYRTSNISNVSYSSTESATTTGTNSSSGASMDTDDSVDLENYYFNNKLNLLEPTLAVKEALRSSETSGNSSAASTLYATSLLSCSSPILKADTDSINLNSDQIVQHLATATATTNQTTSIEQLGGSLTTIYDNSNSSSTASRNNSSSQSDNAFDNQSMSSNQSIVTLISNGASPTKKLSIKEEHTILASVQRNDSGIGNEQATPCNSNGEANSSLKIPKSRSSKNNKSDTEHNHDIIISDIIQQKPSDVSPSQISLKTSNSSANVATTTLVNYRQRTMPATSSLNHRHHAGQRRVFSSCDSSIEHQCADCDQFIDVDHSLVISGALKLQQQRLEQQQQQQPSNPLNVHNHSSSDVVVQRSLLLDSYLIMPPIVCKSCEKKRVERKEIISEFVDTEFKYGRDLKIIHDEFFTPMQIAGLLSKDQINGIFLNLQELMLVHCRFAEKLEDAINYANEQGDLDYTNVNIGKIFINSAEMLHAFESYCIRQGSAACLLARLAKEKELLRIFLRVSQMENTLLRRMNLAAFLMVPVQRVTKYPLLLNRLYKVTAYHHRDREALRDAQLKVELHLEHINQQTKGVGATTKIWRRISNLSAASSRRLTNAEDIGHIKIRKAAIDLLKWDRDETQFVHSGKLYFSPITEFLTKQRTGSRALRYMTAHALLVVYGKPNHKYRPDLVTSSLDHKLMSSCIDNGIKEAALLLMREKNGRFIPCREALFLSNCVLSNDCSTFNDTCQALNNAQSTSGVSSPIPMISACNQTNIKLMSSSPTTQSITHESITKSMSGESNASDNISRNYATIKSTTTTNSTILNQLICSSKNNPPFNTSPINIATGLGGSGSVKIQQAASSAISNPIPNIGQIQQHRQLSPSNSNLHHCASNKLQQITNNGPTVSNSNQNINHIHHLNHHHQPYGDYQESFELHERLTKESILFKADTPLKTRYWLQLLRYHAKDLGHWRRRRNGLANIMMMRQDN